MVGTPEIEPTRFGSIGSSNHISAFSRKCFNDFTHSDSFTGKYRRSKNYYTLPVQVAFVGDARKHHYVPVFYQKNFTNANGLFWVYDRQRTASQELAPKVVCSQKDLYAIVPSQAPKDQRLESQALAIADGMCAAALRELITGKMPPNLTTMANVAYFVALQASRLPSTSKHISDVYRKVAEEFMRLSAVSVERMEELINQYSEATGETLNVSAESMVEAIKGNHLEVVVSERPFLEHLFRNADFLSKVFMGMSWDILLAPADTGFILCDDPLVIVPPYGGKDIGVGIPGAVKYFPLSRLCCLRISDTGETIRYRKIDKEKVAAINKNIAANSERFVMGPDRAQLETVVNDSGSQKMDLQPRRKVFLTNQTDGGSLQVVATIPGRYFYVGENHEAP